MLKSINHEVKGKHIPGLMKYGLIKKVLFYQIKRMKSKSEPYLMPI